jgi:hypothetical protein
MVYERAGSVGFGEPQIKLVNLAFGLTPFGHTEVKTGAVNIFVRDRVCPQHSVSKLRKPVRAQRDAGYANYERTVTGLTMPRTRSGFANLGTNFVVD